MHKLELYRLESPFREDMVIRGYQFGKGEKAACIVGPMRGNEIQQLYICSQLIRRLKELEANGCISAGKQILVVPSGNVYSMNVGRRFWGMEGTDINRMFPAMPIWIRQSGLQMEFWSRSRTTALASSWLLFI